MTVNYKIIKAKKEYIRKIIDNNVIDRLTTAKLLGLPFKEIDIEKDKQWNMKKINAELLQAIESGESIGKMSERLMRVTDMNKSASIRNARTMTTAFENLGRLDGMKKMQDNGTTLQKEWLATLDDKTRDSHAELNGQKADINEPFHSSLGDIMYPGDPSAEPGNVYNCRCTLTYEIEGFEPSENYEVYVYGDGEENRIHYIDERKRVTEIKTVNGETIKFFNELEYGGLDNNIPREAREKLEKFEYKYLTKGGGVEHEMSMTNIVSNFETGEKTLESLFAKGNKTSVEHISGDIVTHIHPREQGVLGGTFSASDLRGFLQDEGDTIRAVAKEGTYSISRKKDFKSYDFEMNIVQEVERLNNDFMKQYGNQATKELVNNHLIKLHNFLLKNQDKYGYFYTLERRNI